ncbi:hypothetical protein LTR62_005795 [Meristemomyces frigidus]|uniref:Amine oxidase n=1 Tax=Meristemomyces frigidus TaxID=1508187 RepID=A0AAN7TD30_9PEZI|nr:hypothetical protein LTR62_005795 [Meristemomyces frigidus]
MPPRAPQTPSTPALTFNPWHARTSPYYTHIAQTRPGEPYTLITPAGQIGIRPDGSIPSDPEEQARQALRNLRGCLEAAGADVTEIIKLTYYIVDFDHTKPWHRAPLLEFLGAQHRPPSTLIPVPKLAVPGIRFEIEAVVAVPLLTAGEGKVDVVVVGAGLSGLKTARDLQGAGLRVKVLEARDRVGGKTWSRSVRGGTCDVGAAWINDSTQSYMYALAVRYGLALVKQNVEGGVVVDEGMGRAGVHPYGQLIAAAGKEEGVEGEEIKEIMRVRDLFEETLQKIDTLDPVGSARKVGGRLDQITFEQWIRSVTSREAAVNALTVGARAMLGVEPSEMSALYFLHYCKAGGGYMAMRSDGKDGGQYLRVQQGTQSFSLGLAAELEDRTIVLQSPVRRIEQVSGGGVRVTSARGVYEAARVVVSVPTPMYHEIDFDPPLPAEKTAVATSGRLGDYCKVILLYKSPWWREHDLCGMSQSVKGPFAVTRETSIEAQGHYSLTCFIVGQPARDWGLLEPAERRQAVLDQIERLYSPFATVPVPIEVVEQIWHNEQWSQGAPCPVLGPGLMTEYQDVLGAPSGRIHFVGTETADVWKGYMEGAVRSGERGALEVLRSLGKAKM